MEPNYPFFGDLVNTLSMELVNFNQSDLKSLYLKWSSQFSDNSSLLADIRQREWINKNQNIPRNSYLNGVDLPTWFGDFGSKKVFFLGIDPMRNERDFDLAGADKTEDVLVGTPYAFHVKAFRQGRTSPYWHVISEVAKSNFVYITDIYKPFFYTDNTKKIRSYDYWSRAENGRFNQFHRDFLMKEISIIKPDVIVTFGALAYRVLTNEKYSPKLSELSLIGDKKISFTYEFMPHNKPINMLPLMHLSGRTKGDVLQRFFENNEIKYNDKIDKRNVAGSLYGQLINDFVVGINEIPEM